MRGRAAPSHPRIYRVPPPPGALPWYFIVMFSILNSAYRPQKIIPNQINTTGCHIGKREDPGGRGCFQIFCLSISQPGRCLRGEEKGLLGAREKRGARAPRISLAPETPFPFRFKRLPRTSTFYLWRGVPSEGVVSFLPYTFQCLAPCSVERKLALGKLLLCRVGRYVKVSTKKRFSGLMSDLTFCQVEVAAMCGRIAIVIS